MGKKTLTNAHCLLDLIEKAPASVIKTFSGLPECQALARGFDWSQDADALPATLIQHVRHLRKDQRDPAEREALRVLRLASPRGAQFLTTVADQLNDNDLIAVFLAQDGGEIGRAVWMRTHSDEAGRLFDVAESILNTGDLRGNKRLYDAFDVPCDEAPPFIWNDSVKKDLEAQLTVLQRLVDAYAAGTHVNTKKLMEDTGCLSPANLFSKASPWKNYLAKVSGAHAWQLNLPTLDTPVDDDDGKAEAEEAVLTG
jgi:hypothetical protein